MTTCLNCGHEESGGFRFCPDCGTAAPEGADPGDSLLGRTLNEKYRIVAEIGAGATGTVYLGEHVGLKKKVALKVLHPDMQVTDEGLQRFQREGIAAGKFSHPNAIQIFDYDRGEGRTFYLAMEYVEGSNLKVFLRRKGRLPVAVALRLTRQLLSVLAEAHRHGIVHRDLKPDNIMVVTGSRGELRVKVLDFGLSRLVDRGPEAAMRTEVGRIMGTPLYMSPEQCAGEEADHRSDLYSVGLILYELVAGMRPFSEESTTELLFTRATSEAPRLALEHPDLEIPEELDAILSRTLSRRREDRFQTAEEMLEALDTVPVSGPSAATTTSATRTQLAIEAHRQGVERRSQPRRVPLRALLAVGAVLALGAVGLGLWTLVPRGGGAGGEAAALVRDVPEAERDATQSRYVGYLDDARAALVRGDAVAAQVAVDQAMGLSCRDAEAFLVRARVYRLKEDDDPALADLREACRLAPQNLEAVLGLGWLLLETGRLDEAEESFAEAAEIEPEDGEVLAARGALAHERGEPEARGLLERAVVQAPTSAEAALRLGRLLLDEGELDAAAEQLVQAKRNDSREWRAYAWLAESYVGQERWDDAEAQLREALRLEPASPGVCVSMASLLIDRGRTGDAVELLEESARTHSDSGRLWTLRGIALREEGREAEAIEALERATNLRSEDADAHLLLGLFQHRAGDLLAAVQEYEAVLELGVEDAGVLVNLGLALFDLGRHQEAAARFEEALVTDPRCAPAHLNLGILHMDYLGDLAQAAEHFRLYGQLGGTDPRVAGWLRGLDG